MRLAFALLVGCGRVGFDAPSDSMVDAQPCVVSATMFCSDFNDGMTTGWVEGGITNGAYLVDNFALRSSSTSITTGEIAEAYVNHYFNAAASRITLGFDFRVTQQGQGDVVVAQIRFEGAQDHGFEYVYTPTTSYGEEFRDAEFDAIAIPGPAFPVDEWHRVEMDMDLRASPRVIVKQDGATVVDSPLLGNATGTARISVGLVYLRGPSPPWTLFFDNVASIIE